MSENNLPKSPEESKLPKNTPPQEGGGFNWRVLIIFAIVSGGLVFAFLYYGKERVQRLSFEEFRQKYYAGEVYYANKYSKTPEVYKYLELDKKEQLFIPRSKSEQGSSVWEVVGKFNYLDKRDFTKEVSSVPVLVNIDSPASQEIFADILKYNNAPFKWTSSFDEDAKVLSSMTLKEAQNNGLETLSVISVEELRKLFFGKKVKIENVLKSSDSTGRTLVVARQVNYADLSSDILKEKAKKLGLVLTEKDLTMGVKYVPFNMKNSMFALDDRQKAFITTIAKFESIGAGIGGVLMSFAPIIIILVILFFVFKSQMKNAGRGAMNFGKSKAKLLNQDTNKVTFKDVAGIQEAKEELYEIVDFLKGPKKFEALGGNIPKGVLMAGPPGTGKTLLARAIAGEADVPFFSISGSDFVEMFVGVGASRVRDMFEQGKKNSPCIVFIDEIDAVGRHRGQGHGGGHDEREQTLNALLVEMDGFDAHSGVIIIAATNRPDVLDPALLRPGRFDRQVNVSLPDYKGREQILRVHAKKIKLAEGTELGTISKGTPGFSGAELANLINEAALLAVRRGLAEVTLAELEEARDKVRWGRERRSLAMSEKDKANTAYHEAGHAICNLLCDHSDSLHKVTIIPRGPALGMAMFLPDEDKVNYREAELIDQLCVAMGGRVAEEIVFGNVTNGAMGDIRQATNIARKMVCEWGMSKELGMVDYGVDESREMYMGGSKNYSEDTAQKIDEEIKEFIDSAYKRSMGMLTEHREALEKISLALLEYETLDGKQIQDILENGEMSNPPSAPTPPDPPIAPLSEDAPTTSSVNSEKEGDDLPPEVIGAPA